MTKLVKYINSAVAVIYIEEGYEVGCRVRGGF
jgi:hypothetical protein